MFIFLIMGFQENCFTDYPEYKSNFNNRIFGYTVKESEYTYRWLWQICSSTMSFHMFVTLTSFVQCVIIGLMIKKYANKKYQYFGVIIVYFTFNIMLIQMTAMRQGYAVDMLLFAYYLLGQRKFLGSLIMVVIAYGFHNSSLIALPFFIALWIMMIINRKDLIIKEKNVIVNKGKGMRIAFLVLTSFIVFYFMKYVVFASYINPILEGMEAFSFSGYLEEFEKNSAISWWIILCNSIFVFFTALYWASEHNFYKKYLAFLVLVYFFLYIGTFGFGNLMRTTLYFIIFTIVVLPNIASMLRLSYGRSVAAAYVFLNVLYVMYFSVPNMLVYKTDNTTGFGSYMFSFIN